MNWTISLILLSMLAACSPSTLEDFQREGEALSRKLTQELQEIRNKEDLYRAAPQIQKRCEQLVDLMMAAKRYQQLHPEETLLQDSSTSDVLAAEMKRIYQIEGGRQVVEKAQREAMIRLDAFKKMLEEQNQSRIHS